MKNRDSKLPVQVISTLLQRERKYPSRLSERRVDQSNAYETYR